MERAQSGKSRGLRLDPRTKILLMITVGLITILSGQAPMMNLIKALMALLPFLLMLSAGEVRHALAGFSAYAACYAAAILLLPLTQGFINLMLSAVVVVFTRFLPVIMMARYTVSSTKVSEFMAAMERMHVTQKIVIPLSVVFRFFPTVKEEYSSISDAMRMRGVKLGGGKAAGLLEYRMIPMMICSVKIGEELSAAALTRGLGAPVKRTNICEIGLGSADILVMLLCVFSLEELRGQGAAILLVTHDFSVAAQLGGRLLIMKNSEIIESGTVAEVLKNPRQPYTKALLDAHRLTKPSAFGHSPCVREAAIC